MNVRRCLVLTAFVATFGAAQAAAQPLPDGAADMQTGLVGRVVLLTRCPVPVGDDDGTCPSRPVVTSVTVRSSDGASELAQVATDADGQFAIALDPGAYLVDAVNMHGLQVTVAADQPTPLLIRVRP